MIDRHESMGAQVGLRQGQMVDQGIVLVGRRPAHPKNEREKTDERGGLKTALRQEPAVGPEGQEDRPQLGKPRDPKEGEHAGGRPRVKPAQDGQGEGREA